MESQSQRVVLAHDASRGVRVKSVRCVLDKFLLEAGDMFTFLSVVHQIQHPMGYMMRVDSSMFGVNQKAIDDEVAKKKKEFDDNIELVQISKLYETQKVDFKIELVAGPILKNIVVEVSKRINATCVIYDTRMKSDKKYFLEKLSCSIYTLKHNDEVIKIRGPKLSTIKNPTMPMLLVDNNILVKEAQNDDDLFSIELESSCTRSTSTRTSISDGMLTLGNNQDDKINLLSRDQESYEEEQTNNSPGEATAVETVLPVMVPEVQLDKKKCTSCNSARPTIECQTRNFSYIELVDATNRFSSENLMYRGENEVVFHGILKGSRLNVMVKVQYDMKKYKSEIQTLEKTKHENVIMLLGTCLEETARLLVFEYACNGSLDQHLSHENSRPLTWPERIKIAIGASRGLFHMHGNNIIHGDMRPKNILLTHDFEPLIAGFGLASMQNESQNSSNHCIIGTLGYLAPEYHERGKATTKTDVYAFGMILLQLVTDLSPTDTRLQGQSLIKWASSRVKEKKFSELIDPEIVYEISQVVNIVHLALQCVRKDPHKRLSMEEVMFILDNIKDGKTGKERQKAEKIEEVNENMETICQSQRNYDDELNSGMTSVPKQAKDFYQGARI